MPTTEELKKRALEMYLQSRKRGHAPMSLRRISTLINVDLEVVEDWAAEEEWDLAGLAIRRGLNCESTLLPLVAQAVDDILSRDGVDSVIGAAVTRVARSEVQNQMRGLGAILREHEDELTQIRAGSFEVLTAFLEGMPRTLQEAKELGLTIKEQLEIGKLSMAIYNTASNAERALYGAPSKITETRNLNSTETKVSGDVALRIGRDTSPHQLVNVLTSLGVQIDDSVIEAEFEDEADRAAAELPSPPQQVDDDSDEDDD